MPGISLKGVVFRFILRRAVTRRLLAQLLVLYGAVRLVTARSHHYFADLAGLRSVVAALLACSSGRSCCSAWGSTSSSGSR